MTNKQIITCPNCDGQGRVTEASSCWKCGGIGSIEQESA